MIWAMLTSTTPSNPSPDYTQDHLSKIVKNTSEIPSDINYSVLPPNKQKDVLLYLLSGEPQTMFQIARQILDRILSLKKGTRSNLETSS